MTSSTGQKTLRPDDPAWSRSGRTPGVDDDWSNWMVFHRSGPLNLAELTPAQIDIADITQGLGATNRFAGQTRSPITVLWHSLMVGALCRTHPKEILLEALMHDAAEAYVGDWIRPLQRAAGPDLRQIRSRIQGVCFQAVGLAKTTDDLHEAVQEADETMLRYEIQAPWGYGRTVTWHEAPTAAERRRVADCIRTHRCPDPAWVPSQRRTFTQLVADLAPESAPIRRSIAAALAWRGTR